MSRIKVKAHTCYLGHTGFNYHSRGIFRELAKYADLKIRNYTWDESPNYLNPLDLKILDSITLTAGDGKHYDYSLTKFGPKKETIQYQNIDASFIPDVEIVLMDIDHFYFYEVANSSALKIAYSVWESTELSLPFISCLKQYDQVWVVSEWHRKGLIKQGIVSEKIFIVHEGYNHDLIENTVRSSDLEFVTTPDRFKFSFFGRWDYRKAVPEIINAFLQEFTPDEPVDLILRADNDFAVDGLNSTEERLEKYGLNDPRVKIVNFCDRNNYIQYLNK